MMKKGSINSGAPILLLFQQIATVYLISVEGINECLLTENPSNWA